MLKHPLYNIDWEMSSPVSLHTHRQRSEPRQRQAELFYPSAPRIYFHLSENISEPEGSQEDPGIRIQAVIRSRTHRYLY